MKMSAFHVLLLFIPIWLLYHVGNFGGFSLGKNLALYLIGYYILSDDSVMEKVERNIKWIVALCALGTIALVTLYYQYSYYGDLWINYIGWNTILVLLVAGKRYLDQRTGATEYLNQASYPIYILHQTILVALAYYIVGGCDNLILQILGIGIGSLALTIAAYHLIRVIPVVRKMIGMN